jgi:YHS domain-containing protein
MLKVPYLLTSFLGLTALGALLAGCSKQEAPAPSTVVKEEATKPAEQTTQPAEVPAAQSDEVPATFASLSETDRAAALAQKVCPVSGETLGEMGTPYKVTVKGRDVFLCCAGCREKIEANPDEYLAKLDAGAKSETK